MPLETCQEESRYVIVFTLRTSLFLQVFDLETSGERCGIIQMSAQIFRIQNNEAEVKVNVFNGYINPGPDAVWNEQACATSHGVVDMNK